MGANMITLNIITGDNIIHIIDRNRKDTIDNIDISLGSLDSLHSLDSLGSIGSLYSVHSFNSVSSPLIIECVNMSEESRIIPDTSSGEITIKNRLNNGKTIIEDNIHVKIE